MSLLVSGIFVANQCGVCTQDLGKGQFQVRVGGQGRAQGPKEPEVMHSSFKVLRDCRMSDITAYNS